MTSLTPMALWNGRLQPLADVRVSVLDRGYLFGDAAYEVVRLYQGKPFLLAEHAARLAASLAALGIPPPAGSLAAKIAQLTAAAAADDASVYIQVSRGEAPRTHLPPLAMVPNELLFLTPLPQAALAERSRTGASALVQADLRWGRCDIKSVNLLGNVMAVAAAKQADLDEALLVDGAGYVTEGAHSSFFAVHEGALVTPPLSTALLPGITRALVLRLAAEAGISASAERVPASHLGRYSEMFLTGTLSEILPIVRYRHDDRERLVGSGAPGPVTRRLQQLVDAEVARLTAT